MIAPQHYAGDAWNYPARPDPTSYHENGVIDGDTFDLWLLLSPTSIESARIRFLHISTSEIRFVSKDSEEYTRGMRHFRYVQNWFGNALSVADENGTDWPLFVRTDWSRGMRGRYLADVYDAEKNSLAGALIEEFGDEVRTPEDWHPQTTSDTDPQ